MLDAILQGLGIKSSAATAGAIGSLISLTFAKDLSMASRIMMFVGGFFISGYLTPLAAFAFSIGSDHYGGIGLLIGIFGMAIVANALKIIEPAIATIPAVIKSRFGKSE